LYDVKCTRHISAWVKARGGVPLMWKTGHSLVKAKLKETGSPLGGEMSGHIFFKDRWYGFDDGLYAGARLLEIISRLPDMTATLNSLPQSSSTPELQLKLEEGENFRIIAQMQAQADSPVLMKSLRLMVYVWNIRTDLVWLVHLTQPLLL
jgi:phosphomannomutase/phosphoglucomutase